METVIEAAQRITASLRPVVDDGINHFFGSYAVLEENALKLQTVSGYTLQELIDLFLAGYTLEPPKEEI